MGPRETRRRFNDGDGALEVVKPKAVRRERPRKVEEVVEEEKLNDDQHEDIVDPKSKEKAEETVEEEPKQADNYEEIVRAKETRRKKGGAAAAGGGRRRRAS